VLEKAKGIARRHSDPAPDRSESARGMPQHLGDTSRVNGLALVLTLATVGGEDTGWQDLKRPCDIRSDVLEKGKWIARRHFESARDCLERERVIRQ
jgi:hypothetical protein